MRHAVVFHVNDRFDAARSDAFLAEIDAFEGAMEQRLQAALATSNDLLSNHHYQQQSKGGGSGISHKSAGSVGSRSKNRRW